MMGRLLGENLKKKHIVFFFGVISLFEILDISVLKICKCDISNSMIARGIKLYQLIQDVK